MVPALEQAVLPRPRRDGPRRAARVPRRGAELRHAVLGAGGIGGLIAAALARSGADVLLLMRRESVGGYPGRLRVRSVVLGDFEVAVPASPVLDRDVDVVWVATKATQLEQALELAPPERVGEAVVVPLLNGVDHVELLRRRYPSVVGAAIRVESERTAPGEIEQKSPFVRLELAGADQVVAALCDAGLDARRRDDETTLLWEKLVFLAPVALATTALDAPLGAVREDPAFIACREEAATAARAAGAILDLDPIRALHEAAPAAMQSSMQKDVAAGREPELAAIAGPIVRLGAEHGFSIAATEALVEQVRARSHEPVRDP